MLFVVSVWQVLCGTLLVACLGSFGWGMRSFFIQPAGSTAGMQITKFCGLGFSILHLSAILTRTSLSWAQALVAALLYLLSLGLFWWAIHANRESPLSAVFSPDLPKHFVKRGPYMWIRHPFYTSYLLTWMAGVAATGRLWLFPSVAVMLLIYWKAARQEEEKFFRSALASVYSAYRSRTGLFIPSLVGLLMHLKGVPF